MTREEAITYLEALKDHSRWAVEITALNVAISALEENKEELITISHFKECYHCGHKSVYWQNDYDFEDFGYEGQGIVQMYTCANCGTEIECSIPIINSESEDGE